MNIEIEKQLKDEFMAYTDNDLFSKLYEIIDYLELNSHSRLMFETHIQKRDIIIDILKSRGYDKEIP